MKMLTSCEQWHECYNTRVLHIVYAFGLAKVFLPGCHNSRTTMFTRNMSCVMGIIAQLFCFSRYVGQGKRGYMLEKIFKLRENNTTVRTELIAGLTTFMTMVYILALNPTILSASGMDAGSVLTATAVASAHCPPSSSQGSSSSSCH